MFNPLRKLRWLAERLENVEREMADLRGWIDAVDRRVHAIERQNHSERKHEMAAHAPKWTDYGLTLTNADGGPFEIVDARTGRFVEGAGWPTADEAQAAAERLARENPSLELLVYGPISTVRADVPVLKTTMFVPAPANQGTQE